MGFRYCFPVLHSTPLRSSIALRVCFSSASAGSISSQTDYFHIRNGRWLWNHEISAFSKSFILIVQIHPILDQKIRYTPFNVEGLQNVACKVASAQRCSSMTKLGEGTPSLSHSKTADNTKATTGSFNKVFLIQFDNGKELLARIPCPVAGNLSLSTASEAATMEYVRLRYLSSSDEFPSFPKIPKVLAWDSSFENPAAWPYILCEHLPGDSLSTKWYSGPMKKKVLKEIIHDIVMFETNILQETFSQHGSIFFTESVSKELREQPLYSEPPDDPLRMDLARRFRIGPTVNREWWRGPYGKIIANRGPCTLPFFLTSESSTHRVILRKSGLYFPSMMFSAAKFQLQCLDSGIDHTSPYSKSTEADIPLLRRLLRMCISISPFMAPKSTVMKSFMRPVLNHPDLSIGNFIIPSKGPLKIKAVIDWQGASVAPFIVQCQPADGMIHTSGVVDTSPDDGSPVPPANFDSMSAEDQDHIRRHIDHINRYRDYYEYARETYMRRGTSWLLPVEFASLFKTILRCIADGPMDLYGLLSKIEEEWDHFSPAPCPIDFSPEEHKMYRERHEEWTRRVALNTDVANGFGGSEDGWIDDEGFEDAKKRFDELHRRWNEKMDRPFPLFDGAPSPFLS